jgi:hypothetical protein
MIACEDMNLFGGHISTVAAVEFCCQIETSGEGLRQAPVTTVHDLLPPGDLASTRPVIVLSYDTIWHTINLSVPHKLIVNFMESLAAGDNRVSLRQALEQASLKFGYFGSWKWLAPSAPEFDTNDRPGAKQASFSPSQGNLNPAWLANLSSAGAGWGHPADFQGHTDSPLAD